MIAYQWRPTATDQRLVAYTLVQTVETAAVLILKDIKNRSIKE